MFKTTLEVLRKHSVLHAPPDKPFKLKSGAESMHYIDVRLSSLNSMGLYTICHDIMDKIRDVVTTDMNIGPREWEKMRPRRIAGVALGGCPLATCTAMMLAPPFFPPVDALYVRPEAKDHGTGKLIEGAFDAGDKVILVEDVVTSGTSTLKALEVLRRNELNVVGVIAVLDREEGGTERISKECPFKALVTMKELLQTQ
jgi:orotate phosphoribosyltransferase